MGVPLQCLCLPCPKLAEHHELPRCDLGRRPALSSPRPLSHAPFPARRLQGPSGSRAAPRRAAAGVPLRTELPRAHPAQTRRRPEPGPAPPAPPVGRSCFTAARSDARRAPAREPGLIGLAAAGLRTAEKPRRHGSPRGAEAPGAGGGDGRALLGRMAADGGAHLLRDGASTARPAERRRGRHARGLMGDLGGTDRSAPRPLCTERAAAPREVTQSPEPQQEGTRPGGRRGRADKCLLRVPLCAFTTKLTGPARRRFRQEA